MKLKNILIILILLLSLVSPAAAVWWNPFTWFDTQNKINNTKEQDLEQFKIEFNNWKLNNIENIKNVPRIEERVKKIEIYLNNTEKIKKG